MKIKKAALYEITGRLVTSGRSKSAKVLANKKRFPSILIPFVKVVKESSSPEEAYKKISNIKNVPLSTSKKFFDLYPEKTPQKAIERFYNEVRGKYLKTISVGNIAFEVFKNPTKRELNSIMEDGVRGLIDVNKNALFIWSTSINEITKGSVIGHVALVHQLSLRNYIPIIFMKNGVMEFSSWTMKNSTFKGNVKSTIVNNKWVKNLGYSRYSTDENR